MDLQECTLELVQSTIELLETLLVPTTDLHNGL